MKVIDASVGFKALVVEAHSPKAERLIEVYRNAAVELIAPDFYPVEVAHALTRAERQGRITPAEGAKLLTTLLQDLPRLIPSLPLLPKAYALSSQVRIGVYDCIYVALAERESCELVTGDDKLVKTFQGRSTFIVSLVTLP
jgi:predicted nucleic acid-binding protein